MKAGTNRVENVQYTRRFSFMLSTRHLETPDHRGGRGRRARGGQAEARGAQRLLCDHPRGVVEGAGGVLVPLNESAMMVDLIVRLALPALIVARSGLGTINHTLLTVEALRSRSLTVAGVLMVGPPNAENADAIATYGRVPVVGTLPWLDPLTPEALAAIALTLDADDCLGAWLE